MPLVVLVWGCAARVINTFAASMAMRCASVIRVTLVTSNALSLALTDLCDLYANKTVWERLQKIGMKQPVNWDASAGAYAALYRDLRK